MSKEVTLNLFLELADSFNTICRSIDAQDCSKGKCQFAKKNKYGDFVCIFEEKGMGTPYAWKEEGEEEN